MEPNTSTDLLDDAELAEQFLEEIKLSHEILKSANAMDEQVTELIDKTLEQCKRNPRMLEVSSMLIDQSVKIKNQKSNTIKNIHSMKKDYLDRKLKMKTFMLQHNQNEKSLTVNAKVLDMMQEQVKADIVRYANAEKTTVGITDDLINSLIKQRIENDSREIIPLAQELPELEEGSVFSDFAGQLWLVEDGQAVPHPNKSLVAVVMNKSLEEPVAKMPNGIFVRVIETVELE